MLGCDLMVLLFWICMMGGSDLVLHLFWICIYDGMLSIYYQHICMWFQLNFVCHVAVQNCQILVHILIEVLLKYNENRGIFTKF